VAVEVEDRVADELARAVVGRFPAPVGLDDLDVHALRQVELRGLVRAPAEGHDGLVLEQDHRVRDGALRHGARERALQREGLAVRNPAGKVEEICACAHGPSPGDP
jgi:hypothetical protein